MCVCKSMYEYLGVFTDPIATFLTFDNLTIEGYLRLNLRVRVVVDYANTVFSNTVIKYLRENEKVLETILACSSENKNEGRKSRDPMPLKEDCEGQSLAAKDDTQTAADISFPPSCVVAKQKPLYFKITQMRIWFL